MVGGRSLPAIGGMRKWSDDCAVADSHVVILYEDWKIAACLSIEPLFGVEFCVVFGWFGKKLRVFLIHKSRRGGNAFVKPVSSLARLNERELRRNSAVELDICYNGGMMMNMSD